MKSTHNVYCYGKIVERLPPFIRNRWIREVQIIRRRTEKNPDITDLTKFVDDAAAKCNDPVYSQINTGTSKEVKSIHVKF